MNSLVLFFCLIMCKFRIRYHVFEYRNGLLCSMLKFTFTATVDRSTLEREFPDASIIECVSFSSSLQRSGTWTTTEKWAIGKICLRVTSELYEATAGFRGSLVSDSLEDIIAKIKSSPDYYGMRMGSDDEDSFEDSFD